MRGGDGRGEGGQGGGASIKGCKERGEWAELCFMARAAGEGLRVSKPYGDSAGYDVGVECIAGKGERRIRRVQVKSTIYKRRGECYSLNVMGPRRERYPSGVVDFFAVYLIPIDAWYIVPYEIVGRTNCSLHFTPDSIRHKYAKYREAWYLLRGETS
jgi:PD-(D/E)XK nuclease superfamily protein